MAVAVDVGVLVGVCVIVAVGGAGELVGVGGGGVKVEVAVGRRVALGSGEVVISSAAGLQALIETRTKINMDIYSICLAVGCKIISPDVYIRQIIIDNSPGLLRLIYWQVTCR